MINGQYQCKPLDFSLSERVWMDILGLSSRALVNNNTVNMVIFVGGKFRENVGKSFHVGISTSNKKYRTIGRFQATMPHVDVPEHFSVSRPTIVHRV